MKKILYIIAFFAFAFSLTAQADKTKKPESLGETPFAFPEYTVTTLSNGVKVFIVEDFEQPTISFRLMFPGGSSMDGNKSGVADLLSEMLMKGTKSYTALQLAEKIEGMGASINASAGNDNFSIGGSCLKKHGETLLALMDEILTNPVFPESEFKKLKPRIIAGIKNEKSSPMTVAGRLLRKIMYGDEHPYGKKATEESIKSITLEDVTKYYKTYLIPNNASLIVVGDVDKERLVKLLEKTFADWKKGEVPKIAMPPQKSAPLGVYFVNRPASVQSTIMVVTKAIPAKHDDYETLQMASSLIGSGFGGRLFRTLREKYSYTYTPFGRLSSNKYFNNFACGADVRNSVTDSAISVIMEQLRLITTETAPEDELKRILTSEIGEFKMAFESSGFVASLLQNADFIGEPIDKVKSYPQRMAALNPYDIQRVAQKYMNPSSAYIIVVGSPEVKEKLEKFGKVFVYDLDLNPQTGEMAKMEKTSLDAEDLIEKYTIAIGGKEEIGKIASLISEGKATMSIQGRELEGKVLVKQKSPGKKYQLLDLGMLKQTIWTDGQNSWGSQMGNLEKKEGEELLKALDDAVMFKETKLLDQGNKCEVLGKQGNEILMKVTNSKLGESIYYFDALTFLLNKIEVTESTPQGPMPITMSFGKYQKVNGVSLPSYLETVSPFFTIAVENTYKLNEVIDDKEFTPDTN